MTPIVYDDILAKPPVYYEYPLWKQYSPTTNSYTLIHEDQLSIEGFEWGTLYEIHDEKDSLPLWDQI
jgi:hypothetical protein